MNDRLRTAVYGFAVGDALGVPYEFRQRGTFHCYDMIGYGTHYQPSGTWSDDTSMLLATCHSIKECGCVNPEDIMHKFSEWLFDEKYTANGNVFDYGNTTYRAIQRYKDGVPLKKCGERSNLSAGNGSLMRILPLAFIEDGFSEIYAVSSLTHASQICIECCMEYILCLQRAKNRLHITIPMTIRELSRDQVKSSGYVKDTLEAALWCIANTESYENAVLEAVNLGDDTDTIAALTGGLAALQYGFDAIPKGWIDKLANKELIERCLF